MESDGIINIVLLGLAVVFLEIQLKQTKPEFMVLLSVAGGVIFFFFAIDKVVVINEYIKSVAGTLKVSGNYIKILLKIMGISYVCDFVSDICKDAGNVAIANQIQIVGKLSVMLVSMPVFMGIFDMIDKL